MLTWFDADPVRYWAIAWTAFAFLAFTAVAPAAASLFSDAHERRLTRALPPWLFVAAMTLCFVAFRWPLWVVQSELNPDESQLIAEAITLRHDPVFWRSVDGTTHGPVDVYPLLLLPWLGLDLDYFGARIFGAALVLLTLFASYRTLVLVGRETLARVAVLPGICLLSFTTVYDFVHYSSEHVPAALATVGCWLIVADVRHPGRTWKSPRWIVAGLLLGAVPLAKLQGLPIAVALLAGGALLDATLPGPGGRARLARLLALAGAASATTAFFAAVVGIFGIWQHAWISYVVQSVHYAGQGAVPFAEWLRGFWAFFQRVDLFGPFATGVVIAAALALVPLVNSPAVPWRWIAFSLAFLLASLLGTFAPRRSFPHYLLLLVAPALLFAGTLWQAAWDGGAGLRIQRTRTTLLLAFLLAAVLPQIVGRTAAHPVLGDLAALARAPHPQLTAEILRYTQLGDRLAVWGWMARHYVLAQLPQATREAHTYHQIMPSGIRDYYRTRYLHDLARHRPAVFVDSVGRGAFSFEDRMQFGHETFASLRDFIAREYRLVAEIEHARIYVRLDRLATP